MLEGGGCAASLQTARGVRAHTVRSPIGEVSALWQPVVMDSLGYARSVQPKGLDKVRQERPLTATGMEKPCEASLGPRNADCRHFCNQRYHNLRYRYT